MFVDQWHADADTKGLPKPYSGPKGAIGWVRNTLRFLFTHHHSESLIPHFVLPVWYWVKQIGPVNALFLWMGWWNWSLAVIRTVAVSMTYIMHADWYNDCCDIFIDAKNKPSRPLPSGRVSRSQGYAIAFLWVFFAGIVLAGIYATTPYEVFLSYTLGYCTMLLGATTYSDNNLPTRVFFRESALGRVVTFSTIYFGFDIMCYSSVCDGTGINPLDPANPILPIWLAYAASNLWFNIGLLVTKDMGDIAGDKAAGLTTVPVALGTDQKSIAAVLLIYTVFRLSHIYFHASGYFVSNYYGIPLSKIAIVVDCSYIAFYAQQFFTIVLKTPAAPVEESKEVDGVGKKGEDILKPVVKFYMKNFPNLTHGTIFDVFLPSVFDLLVQK